MSDETTERAPLRILISAYACAPNIGSEPGAGWAILKAAAQAGECWVLTRRNNVPPLLAALKNTPPRNEVHVIGLDFKPWVLALKRRLGGLGVRLYYLAWQRLARREAMKLENLVALDVAHHVTFSAFWLPVGIDQLKCPLVIGPLSGGERTPLSLFRYLGVRGAISDFIRLLVTTIIGVIVAARWRKLAIAFVSQSNEMARFAKRYVGPRSQHMTFSHALDPPVEPPPPKQREREVLFVGRLVPWKGVALALDAIAAAPIDLRFTIIGDGADRARLERKVRRQSLQERVVFAGGLNRGDVLRRMASSSALLFPSFHDSAGFVVSEALTFGLPVICLDHAGPGEIVSQWPSALSVPVAVGARRRVVAALAAGVEKCVENPAPHPQSPIRSRESLDDLVYQSYRTAMGLPARGRTTR